MNNPITYGPPRTFHLRVDCTDTIEYNTQHYIEDKPAMLKELSSEIQQHMQGIAHHDIDMLVKKSHYYGDSWKSRGGIGAFMMAARKWDRIENICQEVGWDIFNTKDTQAILEEIGDLRCYLLLIENEIRTNDDLELYYKHYGTSETEEPKRNPPEGLHRV